MRSSDANKIANLNALNNSQYGALSHFIAHALINDDYEVKSGSISHLYGTKGGEYYAVSLDLGRKGDEDSLASVLCRDHFHLFIGPRGRIEAKSAPKSREQFKGRAALGAHYGSDCRFSN